MLCVYVQISKPNFFNDPEETTFGTLESLKCFCFHCPLPSIIFNLRPQPLCKITSFWFDMVSGFPWISNNSYLVTSHLDLLSSAFWPGGAMLRAVNTAVGSRWRWTQTMGLVALWMGRQGLLEAAGSRSIRK